LKASRGEIAERLSRRGIEVRPSDIVPEGLLLKGSGPVQVLDEYREGLLSVQDQGSILVGHVLKPEPGMRVLDMCAAPGGKANHIAEVMCNDGAVLALDLQPGRLEMVREAAARLGNGIIQTAAMDATQARISIDGLFDRVLVDAPCSGLGTMARRPDNRWRKRPEDIDRLAVLQYSLLSEAARMLEPGGILVYSTCTVSRRENEHVVERFCGENDEFEPVRTVSIPVEEKDDKHIRLYPDIHGCDGMFIAALSRS
jgi:16S rRNA (cytosine967-C5)-methyltransferase